MNSNEWWNYHHLLNELVNIREQIIIKREVFLLLLSLTYEVQVKNIFIDKMTWKLQN